MKKFIKTNRSLILVILLGAVIRVLFIQFGAEIYFNRENIFFDKDTLAWQKCIMNLIEKGTFTVGSQNGEFSRMPGYPFFMGIFYFISNKSWDNAYVIIGWFQTILDVFCIYLFYAISLKIFKTKKIALISAFLYATYPFIIVWNPVVYAEQWSIFLMLCSLYYFMKGISDTKYTFHLLFCGVLLGLSALTRPQILPLIGIFLFVLFVLEFKNKNQLFKKLFILSFAFTIIFSIWPLRNYVNHNEIIITKNADGFSGWQKDVISFMQFTYAVKSEWEPQYSSIVKNKKTTFPKIAYGNSIEDSLKLEKAIFLSKNCGSGFSNKGGYWKAPMSNNEKNCNDEIAYLFNSLREKQIQRNPLNFYILVPLNNLKKAIFKTSLYDSNSLSRKLASNLFYYRRILIIFGFFGCIFLIIKKRYEISIISIFFFCTVYITLCFGTSPFMRNIEIRYFLQADIIMLFPASIVIDKLIKILSLKK